MMSHKESDSQADQPKAEQADQLFSKKKKRKSDQPKAKQADQLFSKKKKRKSDKSKEEQADQSFPKMEYCVMVITSMASITTRDCVVAIGKLIGPSNIQFVTTLLNRNLCVFLYLNNKETVNKLLVYHKEIRVGDDILLLRSLIPRARKIVIFSQIPCVPNGIISDTLSKMHVSIKSPICFNRGAINEPGYEHILDTTRYVFIDNEDAGKLENRMQIKLKGRVVELSILDTEFICLLSEVNDYISKWRQNPTLPADSKETPPIPPSDANS